MDMDGLHESILHEICDDHHRIQEILGRLVEALGSSSASQAQKMDLIEQLAGLVEAHSKAEEGALYSALIADESLRHVALEGSEKHQLVGRLLKEMLSLAPNDETWKVKLEVVNELLKHNVHEEEDELFPSIESVMTAPTLESMALEYLDRHDEALKETGIINTAAAPATAGRRLGA